MGKHIFRHVMSAGAASVMILTGAQAPAAAEAAETTCVRFPADPEQGPSIWTWGDHDLWVLEAGGQEFTFAAPGPGALLHSGNGEDLDHVSKCDVVDSVEEPSGEPVSAPVEEPAAEEPAAEEPAAPVEEPAAEEPAAEEPVAEEPAAEEPEAEGPVAEEPAAEEPVAEVPVEEPADEPMPFGSSPAPVGQEPELGTPQLQRSDPPTVARTIPTGDAEVLGLQELANSGPEHAGPLAFAAAALLAVGGACQALSRRLAPIESPARHH